jgi:putative proteasome-type protease
VSLDATTRSNITVGPPFEVATYASDSLEIGCRCRFEADDPYLIRLREAWNSGIQQAFAHLPQFDWETDGTEQIPLQPLTLPTG